MIPAAEAAAHAEGAGGDLQSPNLMAEDMKTKKFDCVQMKRLGAAKVREQTAALTKEQELAFWRERSSQLRQRQAALRVHTSRAA